VKLQFLRISRAVEDTRAVGRDERDEVEDRGYGRTVVQIQVFVNHSQDTAVRRSQTRLPPILWKTSNHSVWAPSDDNSKWGKFVPTTKDPQPQLVNHYNIAVLSVDLSFCTVLGPPQRHLIRIPFFCFRQHIVMELIECTSHLVPNHQHQAQLKLIPTGMNRNTHMQRVFVV
jgi:hypothetical protein